MPSIQEGLSMADEETPTPGTESDAFAASLAAKITGETPAVEAPASEENPPLAAPQRDEKGRFVAGAPAASEEEPEVEGTLSPEAQARIREQEAFIGRQSTEIGELRARLEAIEKAQSEPETVEPQGFPQVYITPEQAEAVVERAGPYDAVLAACQDGLDPDGTAFKNIFDAAAEAVESQSQLADLVELRIQYREFLADDGEVEAPAAPGQVDPALQWARDQQQTEMAKSLVAEIKAATPDFEDLAPFFDKAVEVNPLIAPAIQSKDPAQVKNGLSALVISARGVKAATEAATGPEAEAARQAAAEQRLAAQVATGSHRRPVNAGAPPAATGGEEDAVAAFKARFRETNTPTIADGLSLG